MFGTSTAVERGYEISQIYVRSSVLRERERERERGRGGERERESVCVCVTTLNLCVVCVFRITKLNSCFTFQLTGT